MEEQDKNYKIVIGMEVHAELKTETKMFCSCPNSPFESEPNKNICPICLGHPGTLPTINKKAVEMVIQAGKALNCQIAPIAKFDRKNYFYPDLPKGYQISQYDLPLTYDGYIKIGNKKIRIKRIHLEEDAGKLIHPEGADYSLVDFNRAGVPLLELVSEPDIESGQEAKAFCQELQRLFRYLGISDADLEKGQMRCEVNISLKGKDGKLGQKVEIKNLGSFRAVEEAAKYEAQRQEKILKENGTISQETRGWDADKKITFSQRSKEEASDYRYFPEPDLPIIETDSLDLEEIFAQIPELPWQKRERFEKEFFLGKKEIETIIEERFGAEFFEESVSEALAGVNKEEEKKEIIKIIANFFLSDLRSQMIENNISFKELNIKPKDFALLALKFYKKEISSRIAKDLLNEMFISGKPIEDIVKEKGAVLISDSSQIEGYAKEIIQANQKAVADYQKGKENALQFLVGQLMAKTKGKVEPQKAREILKNLLK